MKRFLVINLSVFEEVLGRLANKQNVYSNYFYKLLFASIR